MALIPYMGIEEMTEPHRSYAIDFEQKHGRLPWLRILGSRFPPFVDALSVMYPRFMTEGGLDRVTKELIFVACAHVRSCEYCMGSHSRHLVQELGLTREQVLLARSGENAPGLSPQQRAAIGFARKVAANPQRIIEGDIDQLRNFGFNDSDIVEIVSICAFSAFTNTFTDTLKIADDLEMMGMQDEFF